MVHVCVLLVLYCNLQCGITKLAGNISPEGLIHWELYALGG